MVISENRRLNSLIFIGMVLLGIAIVMQFRTMTDSAAGTDAQNVKTLASKLEQELQRSADMKQTLSRLEAERERLINTFGADRDDSELTGILQERTRSLLVAGLSDVSGDGIVMTLNDAVVAGELNIEDYIIHDSDIVPLLNELRAAGAQAVSINGERILATTKTVCAGPTILINGSRYPVPYEIKAIGDPGALFDAMNNCESVVLMRMYNIRVDIRTETAMTISRYRVLDNLDEFLSGLEVVAP